MRGSTTTCRTLISPFFIHLEESDYGNHEDHDLESEEKGQTPKKEEMRLQKNKRL